ncbi:hypothetical protein ACE1B6_23510 [Aerosakkonemataceae cyanobacterium BLCC-F154]|uniref:DUF11 domain-containing protein n=1 Tax=Floridaenema fluviatile BLCC-F154 TaxID=3153640 RepID=A0ABV4YHC0_9CYAN
MKFLPQRLEQARWLTGLILPGFLAFQALPTADAQTITIQNTSTANYRDNVTQNVRTATSNSTSVSAILVPATLEIIKSADRQAAEPGDTVLYRLLIRNTGESTVKNLQISDNLPLGLRLASKSIKGAITDSNNQNSSVQLPEATVDDRKLIFTFPGELAAKQTLTITYAVTLTPDSLRGNGRNVASVSGSSGQRQIASGTASFQLQIRSGILTDCGTIIGRVFVDRNFDGEQQSGEPGIPNAVIYLDDGNRITTDADGLFSVANVISGYRSGTLDLTSIPGYTLAPNLYNIEKNSQSRLVRLAPGGMVRMNFAVTPSSGEEQTEAVPNNQ